MVVVGQWRQQGAAEIGEERHPDSVSDPDAKHTHFLETQRSIVSQQLRQQLPRILFGSRQLLNQPNGSDITLERRRGGDS